MPDFRDLTLYLIRHGECEHNVERRIGSHDDSPLTEKGRMQARSNGRLLRDVAGRLDDLDFFASSLHRTCTSMELLRDELGLPPTSYRADHRLMEFNAGDHIWMKWDDIPHEHHAAFEADPWNASRLGGESQAGVYARVGRFLRTLVRDTVIVTHAVPVLAIRAHYLGLSPEDALGYHHPNAGLLRLAQGTESYFGD
jgi:broad specificity phosphatase PhoE